MFHRSANKAGIGRNQYIITLSLAGRAVKVLRSLLEVLAPIVALLALLEDTCASVLDQTQR